MTSEQWRAIPGYEGYYEVSDHGRVRSIDRTITRSDGRATRLPGVTLRRYVNDDGRHMVTLSRPGERRTRYVHQLVMLAFVGPRPPRADVCHNNGDASNDRLTNLRYDTRRANIHDAIRHGTHNGGGRTRCTQGHPLVAPNLVPSELRRGSRACLACRRAYGNVHDAKWRGLPHDFARQADEHYERILQQEGASGPQGEAAPPLPTSPGPG